MNFDAVEKEAEVLLSMVKDGTWPRYLVNISDCTSKVVDSSAVESKRVMTMAWILYNFVSHYGASKILHVDNGREFISLCYDRKYQGPKQVQFTDDKVAKISDGFQKLLPGTIMVHGKARHSESQGYIDNRNKVAINFLTKRCLQSNTAYYWMGIPSMRYHINARTNRGNKMSPFEYLYGLKHAAGISSLPF